MRRSLVGSLLVGGMVAFGPVALAAEGIDGRLEERIEKSFDKVEAFDHLDVDVADGVLTLRGEVSSAAEKARAEKLARTAGAKTVVNQLEVDADKAVARIKEAAQAKKDRIDERAEKAKDAVDRQAEVTAERTEKKLDKANNKVNAEVREAKNEVRNNDTRPVATAPAHKEVFDPLVTAKVKTRIIKDDLLDKSDINVDSDKDGLVTLKGTVPSEAARVRALELARTTEGVRKVVDALAVKAPVVK